MHNYLLEELRTQGKSIGSWLTLASPMVAEVMSMVGYRWLCIDGEHSPVGLGEMATMIRAIESRSSTAIVRVPTVDPVFIGQVLDAGALGIVAPHVSTVAQAQTLAEACRYPPRGKRSTGTGRNFTFGADYADRFNDAVVVIAQIEDIEGVEAAADIMAVDGIDIGFLGPKDLSINMGCPDGGAELEQAIAQVLKACQQVGKPAGIPVATGAQAKQRLEQGFKMIGLASDFRMLETSVRTELEQAR